MGNQIFMIVIDGVEHYYAYDVGIYAAFSHATNTVIDELQFITSNGYESLIDLLCEKDGINSNEKYVRENYIVFSMNDLLRNREKLIQCLNDDISENHFQHLYIKKIL